MATIPIHIVRSIYPGMSDEEAARALAEKDGYAVIVRYKHPSSSEYDHFGCCSSPEQASGYFSNLRCKDPEVVYRSNGINARSKDRELLEAVKKIEYQEGETFFGGRAINDVGLPTVQSLIKDGANANVQDEGNGSTPLIHAIQNHNLGIAALLINAGADVNMPNRSGVSPLHMACIKSTEAVTFLLKRGADYDSKTIDGISIIEWAERNSFNESAEIIKAWKDRAQKKNNRPGFLRRLFGKKIANKNPTMPQGSPK